MNLLAGVFYDPTGAAAVSKSTATLIAMTVMDNVNLRNTFTAPPSGRVFVVVKGGAIHGAVTWPQILVGCIESSPAAGTLRGRMVPMSGGQNGTAVNSTQQPVWVEYLITGLTPGQAYTWDLAWGVEVVVAATGWKYGGPNNTTTNDAFGGISFEIWDPSPIYTPSSGAAPTTTINQRLDDIDNLLDTEMPALTSAVAAVQADTDNIQTRIPAALVGGRMDSSVGAMAADVLTAAATAADFGTEMGTAVWATGTRALTDKTGFGVSSLAADTITAASMAADASTETATAVWASGTRLLTAGTNIVLAKGVGVTGFNDLSAAQVNTEVDTGIADAALATAANLATVAGYLDTEIVAIKAKTDFLPSATAGAAGGLFIAGANAATTVNFTGNLSGSVGSVTGAVGSVTGLTAANLDIAVSTRASAADLAIVDANVDTVLIGRTTPVLTVPDILTLPESGTVVHDIRLHVTSGAGAMVDADAAPVVNSLTNVGGTDLSARLDSTTATKLSDGIYEWKYTSSNLDAAEVVEWQVFVTIAGQVRNIFATSRVDALVKQVFEHTSSIEAKTDQLAFTGGNLDANVRAVNDVAVDGAGTADNPWGPA